MSRNEPGSMIYHQLLIETEAMLCHALSQGMAVPPGTVETVVQLADQCPQEQGEPGLAVSGSSGSTHIQRLAEAHAMLAALIAPASPCTVVLLRGRGTPDWRALGNIPLVRRMMLVALGSLVAFIALSLSPEVGGSDPNIFEADGLPLLFNMLFFLSAAAMGASVMLLSTIHTEIESASFPPHHEPLFWLKFVLGLISGLLLSTLFHLDSSAGRSDSGEATKMLVQFSSALLALLGGSSAQVVYRILVRLSSTVEMMLTGSADTPPEPLRARKKRVVVTDGAARGQSVGSSDARALLRPDEVRAGLHAITVHGSEPGYRGDASTPTMNT